MLGIGKTPQTFGDQSVGSEVFCVSSKRDTHRSAFSFTPALDYMKTASALKGQRTILKGLERGAKHRWSHNVTTMEETGKSDRKGD